MGKSMKLTDATADECIELAQALEQLRALKIVEEVTALTIGGATANMPTPFQAGYQLACEEIEFRLRTEIWDGCLPPVGVIDMIAPDSSPRKDE